MQYTNNYNLKKPDFVNNVLIYDLNDNSDIVDRKLKEHTDELATKETPTGAQAKANTAEANANSYTDQQVATVEKALTEHKAENTTDAHQIQNILGLQTALDNKIKSSEKGQPNGVATLDSEGLIPKSQVPLVWEEIANIIIGSPTSLVEIAGLSLYSLIKVTFHTKSSSTTTRDLVLYFNDVKVVEDYSYTRAKLSSVYTSASITTGGIILQEVASSNHTHLPYSTGEVQISNILNIEKGIFATYKQETGSGVISGRFRKTNKIEKLSIQISADTFQENSRFIILGVK